MAIHVDGVEIPDRPLPPNSTVGHAVDLAKARVAAGRLILEVVCDGDVIGADRLREIMTLPYAKYRVIEFNSGSPHATVLTILQEARSTFGESFQTMQDIRTSLTAGDVPAAMEGLSRCVSAWANMHEAVVQGGALVNVDFERLVIGGRHVLDWLGEFNGKLREIRDAVQTRDYVALADILRYELEGTLQNWDAMLDGFIRHVERIEADAMMPAAAVH